MGREDRCVEVDFSQDIAILTKSTCPAPPVTAALRRQTKTGVLLSELLMAGVSRELHQSCRARA